MSEKTAVTITVATSQERTHNEKNGASAGILLNPLEKGFNGILQVLIGQRIRNDENDKANQSQTEEQAGGVAAARRRRSLVGLVVVDN